MKEPSSRNVIVVYQPNETVRLEVELHDEIIWLTQQYAPITVKPYRGAHDRFLISCV